MNDITTYIGVLVLVCFGLFQWDRAEDWKELAQANATITTNALTTTTEAVDKAEKYSLKIDEYAFIMEELVVLLEVYGCPQGYSARYIRGKLIEREENEITNSEK